MASMEDFGAEQVVYCRDASTGLRAIIALHSTVLGPALGGTRFRAYRSEDEALHDVLQLAQGMTYKAAAAGLDLGGGKAVIIGDPATDKSEALLQAYGRYVDRLAGRFITAEDVGTSQADMDVLRRETPYVTGASRGLGGCGDPSPMTARGVLRAMQAAARWLWGEPSLAGRVVVVAGVGKVGRSLARMLVDEGAAVQVADVDPAAVARATRELGVEAVAPEAAHQVSCDVFAPCALGGVLDEATVPALGCRAVVGSANNQLADPSLAKALDDAGVLYVPDYIANAGGLITVAGELRGEPPERVAAAVERIHDTTLAVLSAARDQHTSTLAAADHLAERRLLAAAARSSFDSPVNVSTQVGEDG